MEVMVIYVWQWWHYCMNVYMHGVVFLPVYIVTTSFYTGKRITTMQLK